MGSFVSQSATAPEVKLIDENDNLVVQITYKRPYFTIVSSQLTNCIRLKYSNELVENINKHIHNHLGQNKSIHMVSNFLPGPDIFTQENKNLFNQKLATMINFMMNSNMRIYNKS